MNKFKVGDRVTLSGVVASVTDDAANGNTRIYEVDFGGMCTNFYGERDLRDTAFRDQAAIAALHGLLSSGPHHCTYREIAHDAFKLAEALDAERKKRDGV